MRRKLVQQGASTMMISLPAKWIQEHGLKKGFEISIEPVRAGLLLSAGDRVEKRKTEITLTHLAESSIRTRITTTYRKGYDQIKVNFDNENQFKILDEVMGTRLIGFEIVEKKDKYCLVENITEPSEDQFDIILKKVFQNITSLFNATRERMGGSKHVSFSDVRDIERRVQRYDNFCRRVISKRKFKGKNTELFWAFLTLIVHAQREIYHMNKALGKKVSDKSLDYLGDVEKMYNLVVDTYENRRKEGIGEIHDLEKKIVYKKGHDLVKKMGSENVLIYHLMSSARQFYQANSPLFGLII